jgi:hypothetical protein
MKVFISGATGFSKYVKGQVCNRLVVKISKREVDVESTDVGIGTYT